MASPIWESVEETIESGDVDQITVARPSGVVAGDILLAVLNRASNATTMSPPSGFTNIQNDSTSGGAYNVFWKLATGTEPADYTFTWTSANSKAVGTIHRISGADPTTPVAGEDYAFGSDANPNPPSVNPGSSQDYLSVVTSAIEGKRTHTPPTTPGTYIERNDTATTGGGSPTGHCSLSVATLEYNGQTVDPGTFVASGADNNISGHIIIQPKQGFKVTITEAVGVTDSVKTVGAEFSTIRPAYWNFGVWRNSVGDAYTVTPQAGAESNRLLTIWKSIDDGATWRDIHTFSPVSGTYTGGQIQVCIGLIDNDILHIFYNPDEDTNDKELQYCAWDTTDDTVEFAPEIAYAVGVVGRTLGSASVGIRGTGELVVAFREDPTDGSGELSMIRGTQGSWTNHVDISTGDGISPGSWCIGLSVADNDDVHVTWQDSPIIHRVLRANNTLSTIDTGNASVTTITTGVGFSEIFDGKLFYARLAADGVFKPTVADGTLAEDISFTNRFLDPDVPDRASGVMGVSLAQAGGRLIFGWVQADTQEAVWIEYDPGTDLWGTTPQGTGITVAEGADVFFDAWVRGGNVYALVLENVDATVDTTMAKILTEDLVGTEVVAGGDVEETVTEAVGVTDSTTRIVPFERAPDAEAVGAADSVVVVQTFSRPTGDEAIGVTDSTAFALTKQRSEDEAVGVADSTTPVKSAAQALAEAIGVTDDVSRIAPANRTIDETVGITDLVATAKAIPRTTDDEAIGVTDSTTRIHDAVRGEDEAVGVTDSVARVLDAERIVGESVGVADSITRVHDAQRVIDEAVGVSDSIARVHEAKRTVDEAVGVTDSVDVKLVIAVAVDEAVGITDAVSRVAPAIREISEPAGITDDVASAKTIQVTINESVGITDLVVDVSGGDTLRTVTEPVGITDSTPRVLDAQRSSDDEAVGVSDAVVARKTIRVTITEEVGAADSTSPTKAAAATITEAVDVVDSVSRVHDAERGITEAVGVTDQATADKGINVIVTELVGVADSVNAAKAMAIVIVEGVGVADDTTGVKTILASITEAVGVLDSVSRVVDYAMAVDEGVGVTDLINTFFIPEAGVPTIRDFSGARRDTFTGSRPEGFKGKVM